MFNNDGYSLEERDLELVELFNNNSIINEKISLLKTEIINLPKINFNMWQWIGSVPGDTRLSLQSYSRIFKINKEISSLMEEKKDNLSKIKSIIIEDLIDQIKKFETTL